MKNNNYVRWDEYWIKNNPSKEAVQKELTRLLKVEDRIQKQKMNDWSRGARRGFKISKLNEFLWK